MRSSKPKAAYAEHDADAMKRYFLALGMPERNIKLLKGSDDTNAKLKGYLEEWLPKNIKENSRMFFYFSGHGPRIPKRAARIFCPGTASRNFFQAPPIR